jgi:hypothetical protein
MKRFLFAAIATGSIFAATALGSSRVSDDELRHVVGGIDDYPCCTKTGTCTTPAPTTNPCVVGVPQGTACTYNTGSGAPTYGSAKKGKDPHSACQMQPGTCYVTFTGNCTIQNDTYSCAGQATDGGSRSYPASGDQMCP